jgi:pyridinium-3,5-bisthiocarboxylic acid mononucleotide nickel chelatase
MKIAYLDCFSGISGDMLLGALLDGGLPFDELKQGLCTLPLQGYKLQVLKEERNHLFGTRFLVQVEEDKHCARTFADVRTIISTSGLSEWVKEKSIQVFESLAVAEGKIHGCRPQDVHFHEVGAVDSIIDIVGAHIGVEALGITTLYGSALPLGAGFVESRHGPIPVPAPATIALLRGIPVYDAGVKGELVTPTGAALLKGLARAFGLMPPMTVDQIGYGVGSRNLADRPNLLRILLGTEAQELYTDTVIILESNLDDTSPEWLGFLMGRLLEAGALDVTFCPVQMKKNRPGVLLQVVGKPHQKDLFMEMIFRESTTLGVRFTYSQRKTLERSLEEVDSPWGKIMVKKVVLPEGSQRLLPEYEACRTIAEEKGIPIRDIYSWVFSQNK